MSKQLTIIATIVVALTTLLAVGFFIASPQLLQKKAAASGVTLKLVPASYNFFVGERKVYELQATIVNGSPLEWLDYAKTQIAFDPQYLQLPTLQYVITRSGLNNVIFLTNPSNANVTGKLVVELGAQNTAQAPKTADQAGTVKTFTLAQITFTAQKETPGPQPLTLGPAQVVTRTAGASQEIPPQIDQATYTIGSAGTTPFPTVTPGGPQPTVTPTGILPTLTPIGGVAPQCQLVKFYSTSWSPLTNADLATYHAGDTIRIAVIQSPETATKARIRVKQGTGVYTEWAETDQKKPSSNEFFVEYQLPIGEAIFRVEAEIFDASTGVWR